MYKLFAITNSYQINFVMLLAIHIFDEMVLPQQSLASIKAAFRVLAYNTFTAFLNGT